MKNKVKVPKNSNDKLLSNDVEACLIGIMLLLISLIGLLGKGPVGEFLQYSVVFIFGNFYFLVYLYLIIFSIYLIIFKKVLKIKINLYFFAAILILFSFLIGASNSNVELTISNFTNTYISCLNQTPGISLFKITSFEAISYTGGGYLGYLLRGFLNTCFTPIGTSITIGVFAFVGLSIYLKDFIFYFVKISKRFYKKFKKDKVEEKNNIPEDLSDSPSIVIDEKENKIEKNKEEQVNEKPTIFNEKIDVKDDKSEIINKEENKENINLSNNKEEIKNPIFKQPLFVDDFLTQEPIKEEKYNQQSNSFKSETIDIDVPSFSSRNENDFKSREENLNHNINSSNIVDDLIIPVKNPTIIEEKEEKKEFIFNKNEDNQILKNDNSQNEISYGIHEEQKDKYENYVLPPISLLRTPQNDDVSYENRIVAEQRLEKINELFAQFKIGANAISYTIGPSCTRFNIKMNPGVKVNVLSSIQNEIAINLGGNKTVRLELVVEGRDTSSIEIGNVKIASVSFKDCIQAISSRTSQKDKLLVPFGKGIEGNVISVSLDELPHLLVAGTTGSGKSVFVNTIITSLIMRNRPDELKLMLIDPKKIEFSKYNDLPHLLCPVITEALDGKAAIKKLVDEMEERYSLFLTRGKGCSKLSEYNELADVLHFEKLPNIVMICDEFSDFMSEYGKDIEPLIKRLAQKARACGIYLIICTQRPSINVITGDIKAVIPSRVSLLVPQFIDSKIILDEGGAENLLGNGDMLCKIPHHSSPVRVQGAFISNLDIISICDYIKSQGSVDYNQNFINLQSSEDLGISGNFDGVRLKEKDVLHEKAKYHVIDTRIASTSNLISYFGIGYTRADHILNCLEDEGVIKRSGGGNRRIVVMTMEEYQKQLEEKNNENQ